MGDANTTTATQPGGTPPSAPAPGAKPPATTATGAPSTDPGAGGPPPPAPETLKIGDHEIPIEALTALPEADLDRLLAKLKRKVRADGEDLEIDLLEALKLVPKAKRADRAIYEAGEMRKAMDAVLTKFPNDPAGALAEMYGIGRDKAYAFLEDYVGRQLEYEGMKPEERKRVDEERALREKAARADEYEKREKEQREKEQHRANVQQLNDGLTGALTSAGLPVSEWTMRRAAGAMEAMISAAGRDLTPAELGVAFKRAAEFTRDELARERGSHLETDDDEELIRRVGEDRAKRIARIIGARVKKAAPPAKAPPGTRGVPEKPARKTIEDIREELERRDRDGWG